MSKLPQVRPKDLFKALQKAGFYKKRSTGSHIHLRHPDGRLTSIAIHPRPLPKGTLSAILQQTKISVEKLKELLK